MAVTTTREDLGFLLLRYAALTVILSFIVVPFAYVIATSFKPPTEVFSTTPYLLPEEPSTEAWTSAFDSLSGPLKNSAIIATGTAALALFITIPGAYVFARQDFPGKTAGFYAILIAIAFPYLLLIIPVADTWRQWGLYDTFPGVILAYQIFVTPFAIWILRDFFEKLPANLEEAARVYGCTQLSAFYRVILPLAGPALVATGFLAFLVGWNDFLFSNMLTTGTGPRPSVVSLYLQTVGGEQRTWNLVMAQALTVGTPPTVLYMVSRRYLSKSFEMS